MITAKKRKGKMKYAEMQVAYNDFGLLSVLDVCDSFSPVLQPMIDLLYKINYQSQIEKRRAGTGAH